MTANRKFSAEIRRIVSPAVVGFGEALETAITEVRCSRKRDRVREPRLPAGQRIPSEHRCTRVLLQGNWPLELHRILIDVGRRTAVQTVQCNGTRCVCLGHATIGLFRFRT